MYWRHGGDPECAAEIDEAFTAGNQDFADCVCKLLDYAGELERELGFLCHRIAEERDLVWNSQMRNAEADERYADALRFQAMQEAADIIIKRIESTVNAEQADG